MRFALGLGLLLIAFPLYDYLQPVTCRVSKDISIQGDLGLYEKCQTPWGVYYTERRIHVVSY